MLKLAVNQASGWSGLSGPVVPSHAVSARCVASVPIPAVPSSLKLKSPSVMVVQAFTLNGLAGQSAQLSAPAEFLDAINITTVVPRQLLKRELVELTAGRFGLHGQLAHPLAQVSVPVAN